MRSALVVSFSLMFATAFAEVEWPASFEADLAAHIAATQPSGSAVGTLARSTEDLAGCGVGEVAAGTESAPFDYLSMSLLWSLGIDFRSTIPFGLSVLVK